MLARALDWQSRGRRFEPDLLHIENEALTSNDVGAFFIICTQTVTKFLSEAAMSLNYTSFSGVPFLKGQT